MPVDNYGVLKCRAITYKLEDGQQSPRAPQLSLYVRDTGSPTSQLNGCVHPSHLQEARAGLPVHRAAINITSGDLDDSRLAYWVNHQIGQNPIVNRLSQLEYGFHPVENNKTLGLDYIRDSLFTSTNGRLLPHDIPGQYTDIIDVLSPYIQHAVREKANLYLFGSESRSDTRGSAPVIHNIHMNQGNARKFRADDGVFQDGGLIFHFPCARPDSDTGCVEDRPRGEWLGIFLAFASQAVHTNPSSGHAISGVGWSDILRPDIIEEGVVIREARLHLDSSGTDADAVTDESETGARPCIGRRKSISLTVTLSNHTNRAVRLGDWTIRNRSGCVHTLPRGIALRPMVDQHFELGDYTLSEDGDTILLLNEHGLKVDGVSYNSAQEGMGLKGKGKGGSIVFVH
ncbi:hypothetical protein AN8549.2 [Aspergillus nidulans FGSC A4]|uniref:LTD domain-containing protein n=1 Tax=Emericella nidulans (strain FGSC A4 / ATCC 38163 / CBS 112.46 / NRRL 194 / M139) TaxID=227321 RepID=Q5AT31_EMENI|nr:hypothetical protein [Aspergillus nidulans FGSC A4]EAA66974.1 hypothetical protein AN8549.2 [Aspergillus nidulans FGSC A4]CBF80779.1 TPA: conserved hypothetical protein [Aspergillus nidulans FGSC A4]|eukprot:XP_681818.1 hypothetical protein AN8549.2 [Aspergillus nidulans FGSC A4]